MNKTSKSKRRQPADRNFLPQRGEASEDDEEDYVLTGISFLFQVFYECVSGMVVPLVALLRYVGSEIWRRVRR